MRGLSAHELSCEGWYDAGVGNLISVVYFAWSDSQDINHGGDANWALTFYLSTMTMDAAVRGYGGPGWRCATFILSVTATTTRRYAFSQLLYAYRSRRRTITRSFPCPSSSSYTVTMVSRSAAPTRTQGSMHPTSSRTP